MNGVDALCSSDGLERDQKIVQAVDLVLSPSVSSALFVECFHALRIGFRAQMLPLTVLDEPH